MNKMQRNFTRNKDGVNYDNLGKENATFIEVLNEIIQEMQWGGQFSFSLNTVTVTTKVFGCVDTTTFTGTTEEISLIQELVAAKGHVVAFFIRKMDIAPNPNTFTTETILAAYDLYLQGWDKNDIQDLLEVVDPIEGIIPEATPKEVVDEVIALSKNPIIKCLDPDDGVRIVALGSIAGKLNGNNCMYPEEVVQKAVDKVNATGGVKLTGETHLLNTLHDTPAVSIGMRSASDRIISFDLIED